MDLSSVKACLRVLASFGVVRFKDRYEWSNRYEITPDSHLLSTEIEKWRVNVSVNASLDASNHSVIDTSYFKLPFYLCFHRGTTVRTVYAAFQDKLSAGEFKKVTEAGVLAGVLRRVHAFARVGKVSHEAVSDEARLFCEAMDGSRSDDQIREIFNLPYADCKAKVESEGVRVWEVFV